MPYRKIIFINNQYYHIYNQSWKKKIIFSDSQSNIRAISLLRYYQFAGIPFAFSNFNKLLPLHQSKLLENLKRENNSLVKIIAYCLMPNHYHLLLKQVKNNGIKDFTSNFQNGYAKYFNIVNKRKGPLFNDRFRAVVVTSDEQLLHLSRYIHLNPYSSGLVNTYPELLDYPWSSIKEYLNQELDICHPTIILTQFNGPQSYKSFLLNQAEYQKTLQSIRKSTLED